MTANNQVKRILGIDPGSRITGYGVIEVHPQRNCYITCGCIRSERGEFGQRLADIYHGVVAVIEEFSPQELAIEQVFLAKNPLSALKLGQARGVAIAAAVAADLELSEYAARQVKQAVSGSGRASKEQVQLMVRTLLNLNQTPTSDAADALAVALCHAHATSGFAATTLGLGATSVVRGAS